MSKLVWIKRHVRKLEKFQFADAPLSRKALIAQAFDAWVLRNF